jgi:hypothetical protein
MEPIGQDYLRSTIDEYRRHKTLADRALAQATDEHFFAVPAPESNSLALIVKHVAGNLRSRFTDFLDSDGEKPGRDRDREFEITPEDTRASLMEAWETGWARLFGALEPLGEEELRRTVHIRGEPHTVVGALQRSLAHTVSHTGQIVLLAKLLAGASWRTLSIPRGKSQEFLASMHERHGGPGAGA